MVNLLLVDRSPQRGLPFYIAQRSLFDYLLGKLRAASRVQIGPVEEYLCFDRMGPPADSGVGRRLPARPIRVR